MNKVMAGTSVSILVEGELEVGDQARRIDSLWDARNDASFDADVLHVRDVLERDDTLVVACAATRYRYMWADHQDASLGLDIYSLGVSGITIRPDGSVLVGRRAKGSFHYGGLLELVPSGSVDNVRPPVDHHAILIKELKEESGLRPTRPNMMDLGVAYDSSAKAYDIAVAIELGQDAPDVLPDTAEYNDLRFMDVDEVQRLDRLIWTSTAVLEMWRQKGRDDA